MENQKLSSIEIDIIKSEIEEQIRTVYDPEISVNIFDLGLIYKIDLDEDGNCKIIMTLTSAMCPAAQTIPVEVKQKVEIIQKIKSVNVEIVWEPRWDTTMMSDEARVILGM